MLASMVTRETIIFFWWAGVGEAKTKPMPREAVP
jgi:hypothetical protein